MKDFESLFLITTKSCNLACRYCYEHQNHEMMDSEIAFKSIDLLVDRILKANKKNVDIVFFGGEPLLNMKLLNEAFDYGLDLCIKYGLNFRPSLITNCTIFNDEYYNFLRKWKCALGEINVQLSIDGIKEIQDNVRISKSNIPSSELVERALAKYTSFIKEFDCEIGKEVHVHSVISKESLPYMAEGYKYLTSFDIFPGVWDILVQEDDWDDNDVIEYRKQLTEIKDYILEINKKSNTTKAYDFNTSLSKKSSCHPDRTCGAGVETFCVEPNGDIYPCARLIYDEFKLGNIMDIDNINSSIIDKFKNVHIIAEQECSNCNNYECYRCIAANYEQNGNLSSGFPKYCKMALVEQEIRKELESAIYNESELGKIDELIKSINNLITPVGKGIDKSLDMNQEIIKKIDSLSEMTVIMSQLLVTIAEKVNKNEN